MALDPSDRLFAGVVLIVVGFVGLVCRQTGYGMIIGDLRTGSMFYGGRLFPVILNDKRYFYNRGITGDICRI